jgi:caa(3)-type oxidase subunit IV
MRGNAVSGRGFFVTWIALVALTGTSFGFSYLPLGRAEAPVAIGIALVKGFLVAAIFMELIEQRYSHKITIVAGAAMLILLASLLTADVLTRSMPPLLPAPQVSPAARR